MLRRLKPLAFVAALLAFAGFGADALADGHLPRAVTATDGLSLRAAANGSSRRIRRLDILTEVYILRRAKGWAQVQANYCPVAGDTSAYCETSVVRGWVADSHLAFDNRFKPMAKWRAGTIEGRTQNETWSYRIAADASFRFESEAWELAGRNDICPAEQQDGPYCVRVRKESGRFYRYRNVVRAGKDGVLLYVDRRGALCDRMSSAEEKFCDR